MERESRTARALLAATVALVGLNLRPFMTGIGPLAADIRAHTGLDLQGIALLTLVPMLLMGLLAFTGPSLQARLGAARSILAALVLLGFASFLRLFVSTGWQMVGTAALLGFGAAIVQAVFPGIIKAQYPRTVGLVMGLYSAMLMAGGALGAQAAPMIAAMAGDWHTGLAWMAAPAVLALWLAARSLPRDAEPRRRPNAGAAFIRRPRTWLLMACFGLVNGGYASAVAWLAPAYQDLGWTAAASGRLLAIMALSQAVAALALPALAGRQEDRRPWLWLTLAMQAAGFIALAVKPEAAPILWMVLLGAGLGGCFSLSMIVALEHLRDPGEAGALSALMQGGGCLIAAIPPWIVAVLHDATESFAAGWILHVIGITVVAALYRRVSPEGYAAAMSAAAPAPRTRELCS